MTLTEVTHFSHTFFFLFIFVGSCEWDDDLLR